MTTLSFFKYFESLFYSHENSSLFSPLFINVVLSLSKKENYETFFVVLSVIDF